MRGMQAEMIAVCMCDRVTFKQRDNRFFPPSAYALALLLVRIPFQLVEAALFTLVVYFWVGTVPASSSPVLSNCIFQ